MADKTLPGYQPRKFTGTGCVKDFFFFSASKVRCLHLVTVAVMLLQLIYYDACCNIADVFIV